MKIITAKELKNRTGEALRLVSKGLFVWYQKVRKSL
jgi:hypothetical protein